MKNININTTETTINSITPIFRPYLIGTLSNDDGNVNDDGSEKLHFLFAFKFFVEVTGVEYYLAQTM